MDSELALFFPRATVLYLIFKKNKLLSGKAKFADVL